jgi:hypothetical protein
MNEDIDYKLVSDMLLKENEQLKIRIAAGLYPARLTWPDFRKLTRWISDPMHLYGVFIGLCCLATVMQCVALIKEIKE